MGKSMLLLLLAAVAFAGADPAVDAQMASFAPPPAAAGAPATTPAAGAAPPAAPSGFGAGGFMPPASDANATAAPPATAPAGNGSATSANPYSNISGVEVAPGLAAPLPETLTGAATEAIGEHHVVEHLKAVVGEKWWEHLQGLPVGALQESAQGGAAAPAAAAPAAAGAAAGAAGGAAPPGGAMPEMPVAAGGGVGSGGNPYASITSSGAGSGSSSAATAVAASLLQIREESCKPWCAAEMEKGANQLKLACTEWSKCGGCARCRDRADVDAPELLTALHGSPDIVTENMLNRSHTDIAANGKGLRKA